MRPTPTCRSCRATRRVGYQVALENPALFLGTLLWSKPPQRWLNGIMLRILEPRLRRKFRIHPRETEESRQRLRPFLPELQSRVAWHGRTEDARGPRGSPATLPPATRSWTARAPDPQPDRHCPPAT